MAIQSRVESVLTENRSRLCGRRRDFICIGDWQMIRWSIVASIIVEGSSESLDGAVGEVVLGGLGGNGLLPFVGSSGA